jgi:hypothetical protein
MRDLFLASLLAVTPLTAGRGQTPGSPQNCRGLFTATIAGGLVRGDLRACAPFVIPEVSQAIVAARGAPDARAVIILGWYSNFFRDPAVFQAALDVAADPTAPNYARAYGLMTALGMVAPKTIIGPGPDDAIRDPNAPCFPVFVSDNSRWWVDNTLPADAEARLRAVLRAMSAEGGATVPTAVAGCVDLVLGLETLTATYVAAHLSVRTMCKNTFEVRNTGTQSLALEFRVVGSDETGPFNIRQGTTETLFTDESGTVQLIYMGIVVATADPAGAQQCPR